jgi:site-specific DNA-cytosine methylase
MYHELINSVKNTFEHSLSINNMPNDLEFKSKIAVWLKNRLNVINRLNNNTKKLYLYKKNGSKYEITDNFLIFEYFDLSYFYSSDEIKKIKSLCYLRTESHVKRRDETYEMIEQFFKNPLYVSVDKAKFDDKESMEFLIFQAVHTYDQIINQLVQTRYEYLVSMRSMISKQKTKTRYSVRRLTPVECERLMGWPDNHTELDKDGNIISDSARYKMIGNGIVSPVAQWVCTTLLKALEDEKQTVTN